MTTASPVRVVATDANQAHLLARLALVGDRVDALVGDRQEGEPDGVDPLRGLYLSDAAVRAMLVRPAEPRLSAEAVIDAVATVEREADRAMAQGEDLRLGRLVAAFGLTMVESETLLIALAPDVDARFEHYYGFLNDDVTQRRATPRLVMDLLGRRAVDQEARRATAQGSTLVRSGLLTIEDAERPFLSRVLRVPDAVTAFLLGVDELAPVIAAVSTGPPREAGDPVELARSFREGARLAYVRGQPDAAGRELAARALRAAGFDVVSLDLGRWDAVGDPDALVSALTRHARLHRAGVIAGPVERLLPDHSDWIGRLTSMPVPVVVLGSGPFDPRWADDVPLLVDAEPLTTQERLEAWRGALGAALPEDVDPLAQTRQFRLGPAGILRAAQAAALHARMRGGPVDGEALRIGARAQNATGLDRLVRRIQPDLGWDDLVLPGHTRSQLVELASRARFREQVLHDQRMRPGGGRGRGVTALFTGGPGTGKTMSAEVLTGDLGLDLYVVNLATIVDKYIGETEKKLERIFDEAATVNGVLLFDEADALFGKRSEVRDAHDRYANVEVAYLLQRMESFDGLAILTTNLRANLDAAFIRRLDAIIDFPRPDETQRRALWQVVLRPLLQAGGEVDLDWCASSFELSGGEIRSAAVTAAYFAADEAVPVGMAQIVRAVEREYRKHNRLLTPGALGVYRELSEGAGLIDDDGRRAGGHARS